MICDVCHSGELIEQLVRYNSNSGEQLVIVDNVPATVCPNCGETSFRPDVADALLRTVWSHNAPARVIETPVYEFAP